jgi:hypothetical protein
VTIRPSRTRCSQRGPTAVLSWVVSSTAWWAQGTPPWCASADNRWAPGAPGFWVPRSVVPSRAPAGSGASGGAGRLPTTRSAHAPRWGSNSSRSTCRKMVGSVAAQGVAWVKPRACAMRVPSWRPQSAMALSLRAPQNLAQHASAKMAVQGCRVPRGFRTSGIAEHTAMRGRGCALIRLHLWRGVWLRCGRPSKQRLTSNTTLYLPLESVMQSLYEN